MFKDEVSALDMREAIVARIYELCDERKVTVNGLATSAAVPPSTIKSIMNGTSKNPGAVTLKKLCDGFEPKITIIEFFDTDVFRNLEQEIQ